MTTREKVNSYNVEHFHNNESAISGDSIVIGFVCLECGEQFDQKHGNFIRGWNCHCDKCTIEKYGTLNDFYIETIKEMCKEVKK